MPKGQSRVLYYIWDEGLTIITVAVAAPILYIRRENEIKIRLAEGYHTGSDYIASTVEGGNSRVYI